MKVIIFAGGSGKRFWPASRKNNPKQFQDVINNKPLIKLKYDYLRMAGIVYKLEVENILSDLPKQNFIYEPFMRDTGPAVLYATEYIYNKYGNVPILIQWADYYIKRPKIFIAVLKKGENLLNKQNKTLIVGVPIRFASPHRGHIKNGKVISKFGNYTVAEFKEFVEKPTVETAVQYIKSGQYTWNSGYFITKPTVIFKKYKEHARSTYNIVKTITSSKYNKNKLKLFENCEKKSFDYIFAENLKPS